MRSSLCMVLLKHISFPTSGSATGFKEWHASVAISWWEYYLSGYMTELMAFEMVAKATNLQLAYVMLTR